ncbi:MAG TPA: type III secretion system cytoplasmic ring protein SctQ [Steroidobacteraceae bacterium]
MAAGSLAEPVSIQGAWDVRPVVQRLQHLAAAKATALRTLFSNRDVLMLDGEPAMSWAFSPAPFASPHGVLLRGASEEISMSLNEDALTERPGVREWWDYDGDSRLLAWTLAHAPLLDALGRVLREPLIPYAWSDTAPSLCDALSTVVLTFTAAATDRRVTSGVLRMSAAMASRLAGSPDWLPPQQIHRWAALPASLRIELRGMPFPWRELTVAEIGDVLVLGRRAQCWRKLHLVAAATAGAARWTACYDDGRITIVDGAPYFSAEVIMMEPTPEADAPAAARALESVPVTVDFELGSLALPLGELAALKPGYVFQLAGRLDEARVVIRANGVRVGCGELVAVGDVLGVQLLAIEPNGLR